MLEPVSLDVFKLICQNLKITLLNDDHEDNIKAADIIVTNQWILEGKKINIGYHAVAKFDSEL